MTAQVEGGRARERLARGLAWVIAVVWSALLFLAFRPGVLNPDSVWQWRDGLVWNFTTWHPPLITLMSGLAARTVGSPWPLLAAQLLAVSLGFAALAVGRGAAWWRVLLLVAILLVPAVWASAVVLVKDSMMAAALLWAVVALRARRPLLVGALLVLAALFRYNALLAIAPLAAVAAGQLAGPEGLARGGRRRFGVSLALLLAAAIAIPALFAKALGSRDEWPLGSVLVFDIAGVIARNPERMEASVLREMGEGHGDVTFDELRGIYAPWTLGPMFWDPRLPHLDYHSVAPHRERLRREWLELVRAHPRSYLQHRLEVFGWQLALPKLPFTPFQVDSTENPWGYARPTHGLARRLSALREESADSITFLGWFWLGASVALGLFAWRRRDVLLGALAASSLFYILGYALVGVAGEFRYLYWPALAVLSSVLIAPGRR